MGLQDDVCMSDRCLCSSNIMFYYRTIASNSFYVYVQCVANSPPYLKRKKKETEKYYEWVPPIPQIKAFFSIESNLGSW